MIIVSSQGKFRVVSIVGWSIILMTLASSNPSFCAIFVSGYVLLPPSSSIRNNNYHRNNNNNNNNNDNHRIITASLSLETKPPSSTRLHVVADFPIEKEGEEISKRGRNNDNDDDWIPSPRGGFIPIFKKFQNRKRQQEEQPLAPATTASSSATTRSKEESIKSSVPSAAVDDNNTDLRRKNSILKVIDIHEYKKHVADETNQIVCVRFYMDSCRSCKATEGRFRRLASSKSLHGVVKFVEVPVTKDNAYLHQGLNIPSFPYSHIYHPNVGLVEELKINRNVFKNFERILQTYVDGQCNVKYNDSTEDAENGDENNANYNELDTTGSDESRIV